MSFRVEDHYDLKKRLQVDHNMIFLFFIKSEKVHVLNVIHSSRSLRHEKHIQVDHDMIFHEEPKSSCVECHSKFKTTTT